MKVIVRTALAPAAGSGPVVGASAVRASQSSRAGHPATVHSLPVRAADELARTTHPTPPSPASEGSPSSGTPDFTPCDDPATAALLKKLVRERYPSIAVLESERFYSALSELLERHVGVAIGEWRGYLP